MADLNGGQLLSEVENTWPKLGILLRQTIIPAIRTVAQNAAVATSGELDPPSRPGQVNVKVAGEIAHVTINDPQQLQRGAQYHVEVSNDSQFSQPHVEHLGSSRGRFLTLPTNDDGGTVHNWYARAYTQYQGSKPSGFTYFGGDSPTAFQMTGSTNLTPLASTGSGTASNNGQQGGSGLGKVLYRPAPGAKRQVNG